MSQLLYDVDERISSIKNSLLQISENFEITPSKNLSSQNLKKREYSSNKKSPKSSKKSPKNAYVSTYVAFGNTENSSSSDELEIRKKVTFDPSSSSVYNNDLKALEGKSNEIIEFELLLNYEKEKNSNLEAEHLRKDNEIIDLKADNKRLIGILEEREKEIEENRDMIQRLKQEIRNLEVHIERYQSLIREFEEYQKTMAAKHYENLETEAMEQQIYSQNQEITELKQSLEANIAEIQMLQNSNKELSKHNSYMEKFIQKTKDKGKTASEKKMADEIKHLKHNNELLKDELKKRPTESTLKDTEKKLNDLEKIVNDYCGKKPKAIPKAEKIIISLKGLLKTSKTSEIYSKVFDLVKSSQSSTFSLSKKLRALIIKFSPPGTFSSLPSDKRIHSWIQRLIEEYLLRTKENSYYSRQLETLNACMKLTNVTFPEDLLIKLESLFNKSNN